MNRHACILGIALLSAVSLVSAQDYSDTEKALARAGISIAMFDELSRRCANASGFSPAQQKEADSWQGANGVAKLRTRVQALNPQLRGQIDQAAGQVLTQVAGGANPCVAAVSVTRLAESQFAGNLPQLLADAAPTAAASATATASAKPSTSTKPAAARPAQTVGKGAELAAKIEGFGFDTCTRVGYGGMVMVSACPIVLFRDGVALTDVEALGDPRGLEAHKAAKPKYWTRWRRSGGNVQLDKEDGWKDLGFTAVYSTLPKNFTLDGRFRSMGGGGTVAIGGSQAVAAWTDYVFFPDGRVERGGGAGASSSDSGVSVTTGSAAASRTGRYRLDGLVLVMDFDDGSGERRIIIADPKDGGKGTMWLDGEGYVYRK